MSGKTAQGPSALLRRRRRDILLILLPLLLAAALWAALRLGGRTGGSVTVRANGAVVAVLPLDRDDRFLWEGEQGTNLLVIENGTVRMEDADCPDRLCVHQGAVSREGESIVCLPHKLTATVTGGSPAAGEDAVDAVAR